MARNWNPKYEVNILSVFDRAYSDSSDELKNKLRPLLKNQNFKTVYGQRLIDKIVDRTQEKKIDQFGNSLGVYSEVYRNTLIFKIYKGSEKNVNLTLTGDMLSSLRNTSKENGYKIIINLEGEENRNKAAGAVYGIKTKKGKVIRNFLGLPEAVEEKILSSLIKEFKDNDFLETEQLASEAGFSDG